MKILIVSGAFYPGNSPRAFRTTELAKELSRLGHDVTIYIPKKDNDYSAFLKQYPMKIKYFYEFPETRKYTGVSIIDRIIFHYAQWLIKLPALKSIKEVKKSIADENGYDLLITIAVPHYIHWAVGKLYTQGVRLAETWVADCGDSFMFNKAARRKTPFYFKPLEVRWCKACDYIAVPLESEKENYYPEFREKIRVIPQGFNFDDVKGENIEPNNAIITFAYAGSFIPGIRDPRPLLNYLSECDKSFKFIIYTSTTGVIDRYRDILKDKLEIRKPIPRLELIKALRGCDFLVNIDNGAAKGRPSKLIDYALVGRPIISLTSSNIDIAKIEEFLNKDFSRQYVVDDISQFDIHNVAQQFLDLCK